jgi:hypothetical protein
MADDLDAIRARRLAEMQAQVRCCAAALLRCGRGRGAHSRGGRAQGGMEGMQRQAKAAAEQQQCASRRL